MNLKKTVIFLCAAFMLCDVLNAEGATNSYDGKTEFIVRDSSFSEKPPAMTEKIKEALSLAKWKIGESKSEMILPAKIPADSVTVMGETQATEKQMLDYLLRHNPQPKLTCSPEELIHFYYIEGNLEGIRPDYALGQAFKETGYFNYGGDVLPNQNNYCGLGATGGGNRGLAFPSPQIGARAHIQHIKVYASKEPPKTAVVDPRYILVKTARPDIFGNVKYWTGFNGKWAIPGTYYGQEIIKSVNYALAPNGSVETIEKGTAMVSADPTDYAAYAYRAIAHYNGGKYKEALKDFNKALSIKETWEIYYDRGILCEKLGQKDKAIEDYTRASELSPNEDEVWYNRGLLYFGLGDYNKAKADFMKVLSLHPQVAEIASYKGIANIKLGEYDEAWTDFYKASQINTVNPIVKANRLILEQCCSIAR